MPSQAMITASLPDRKGLDHPDHNDPRQKSLWVVKQSKAVEDFLDKGGGGEGTDYC